MENAKQHWKILQELARTDLANRVRSFMVVGRWGDGLMVATEDGEGFWLGTVRFGSNKSRTVIEPIPLNVPNGLVQMAQGDEHILLLNKNGQIYEMKIIYGGMLRLKTDDQEISFLLKLISNTNNFTSVRCGHEHSMALTEDGKVWAWGEKEFSQFGGFSFPFQIPKFGPHRVVSIECGGFHSLALTDRGDVYSWGGNNYYNQRQVGNKSESSTRTSTKILNLTQLLNTTRIPTTTPILTPSPVKSMAAGLDHTLLLTRTGEVYTYGSNKFGQLGLPTTTKSSAILDKVEGLPPILQIASHPLTNISIAMSFDHRCFVWGKLHDQTSISTPRELPPSYSTVESPLSFYSIYHSTPHSVTIPVTPPNPLSTRMSRMFDNPETSDVQFVVEQQRTIHAHRIILINSLDYFARMFSERWLPQVDPEDPIVRVTIPDVSYEAFHAFLHFLYTDSFEVHPDFLSELFELASLYLVPELQQLCIWRMRTTLTTATFCLYYPLTYRHSQLPELVTFQQEMVQFASIRMSEVVDSDAFQSMESDLCDNLINAVGNFLGI